MLAQIVRLFRQPLTRGFSGTKAGIVEKKLNYGQGGTCLIHLSNSLYNIQFETIWEDHCQLQIEGISDENELSIYEEGGTSYLRDTGLQESNSSPINIKFRLPEDYTIKGLINGSLTHKKSSVSNRIRSENTEIELVGKNRVFQWGKLDCSEYCIKNRQGAIDISQTTFQTAQFFCNSLSSEKLLFSEKMNIQASHSISVRSIVTYGTAVAHLFSKYIALESISGTSHIDCSEKIRIDRLWGSPGGINIKTGSIEKIGIETGTGFIQSKQPIDSSRISLGKLHKGCIKQISAHRIEIE